MLKDSKVYIFILENIKNEGEFTNDKRSKD